jgi:methylated-DNA-[protein]-cysteine S-methyltransferase
MPVVAFQTALGECQLEWTDAGLRRFRLPGDSPLPSEVSDVEIPAWVQQLITRVQHHLAGTPQDFADVPFDLAHLSAFHREVLGAALLVRPGETRTYGWIAKQLGKPASASRAVGSALGNNPLPLLIPCHRFIAADGKMTGFSGPGGVQTKLRLLQLERAELDLT